ncbi:MAG: HlyD family efflux transporter periplasmic adaptor subunit, partial [Planctomycetota bacterium]
MAGTDTHAFEASGERPQHRGDLEVYSQCRRGETVWVLKDPVSLRYFQFSESEFAVFRWLDGVRGLQEVLELYRERFTPKRLAMGELRTFVATLHRRGLLRPNSARQSDALWERRQRSFWEGRIQSIANPLAIRLPGMDPSGFVARLHGAARVCFTPWAIAIAALSIVAAFVLLIARIDSFAGRALAMDAFFSPANLILLSAVLAGTKVVHEFAHAVACHHFGARCHEMGVMFLVFTPCLYCDVTDGWKLRERSHRVAISAAGILVELVLASWCGLLWCITVPGLFNSMLFNVMMVCSVGTLFINANPLLRYDGYYILSDLTDRPNLWQSSRRQLHHCLGRLVGLEHGGRRDIAIEWWQVCYAMLSSIYRVFVLVSIGWLTLMVCGKYGVTVLGYLLVAAVAAGAMTPTLNRTLRAVRNPNFGQKMKRPRFISSVLAFAAVAIITFCVPLPCRVSAPVRLQPTDARHVFVTVPGTLVEGIAAGKRVQKGEVLARLENDELTREMLQLRSKIESQRLRVLHLNALRHDEPTLGARLPAAEETLRDQLQRLRRLQRDDEALSLKAPVDGVVLEAASTSADGSDQLGLEEWSGTPTRPSNLGALMTRQTLFCVIQPSDQFEVELFVDHSVVGLIQSGQSVRLTLETHRGRVLDGKVIEVSRASVAAVPSELVAEKRIALRANQSAPQVPTYRVLVA